MIGYRSKEEYAKGNKEGRVELYLYAAGIAAFFTAVPIGWFFSSIILDPPQPVSSEFAGVESEGWPVGGSREVYHHEWASAGDAAMSVVAFVFALVAGVAFAALMYCVARFLADPIMYRIDMHFEMGSTPAIRLKRAVMGAVLLIYLGVLAVAFVYHVTPDDRYVWLQDSEGVYHRVDRETYEKYTGNPGDADTRSEEEKAAEGEDPAAGAGAAGAGAAGDGSAGAGAENPAAGGSAAGAGTDNPAAGENDGAETPANGDASAETPTTEDRSKTPVERGYPSNDIEYYVNHPDEPMPPELVEELMIPDEYNPGMDYVPGPY